MSNTESDSFFMFLTSEANLDIFPNNKPSEFTTQFNNTLELKGKFECSLFDIIVPKPNPIVSFEIYLCYINNADIYKTPANYENNIIKSFMIGPQILTDKSDFIKEFINFSNKIFNDRITIENYIKNNLSDYANKKFVYIPGKYTYSYHANENKAGIMLHFGNVYIEDGETKKFLIEEEGLKIFFLFDEKLGKFLNLSKYIFKNGPTEPIEFLSRPKNYRESLFIHYSQFKTDITIKPIREHLTGIEQLNLIDIFVTANFINETYLNDVKFPILRLVHIDNHGKCLYQFEPKIYYKVILENLNSVQIKLYDKNFNQISFENGSTIIILNFKKVE